MVHSCKVGTIRCGDLYNLRLSRHRRCVLLVERGDLRWTRLHLDATWTIVAGSVNCGVVDDRVVVDLVHRRRVHVVDRAVVIKAVAIPITTLITEACVSKAIINAAIVTDMATPVSAVISITMAIAIIVPVTRCPKRSLVRCINPCARHPVIAVRCVVPVTGSPNVVVTRTLWLFVFR